MELLCALVLENLWLELSLCELSRVLCCSWLFLNVHIEISDVDATTKIDVRVGFWREPFVPGDRIVKTWVYTGTCSQLSPRLRRLLNGCVVINELGISCYEDLGAQHLYHLVRSVADAVVLNKNCEFWLRDVGVYTAHAHQWRTLFTRLQVSQHTEAGGLWDEHYDEIIIRMNV